MAAALTLTAASRAATVLARAIWTAESSATAVSAPRSARKTGAWFPAGWAWADSGWLANTIAADSAASAASMAMTYDHRDGRYGYRA